MNLDAIRTRIAELCDGCGFNPYSTLVGSPDLPAAIVGYPEEIAYTTTQGASRCEITMFVKLICSLGDEIDATKRLDDALSTNDGSVYRALSARATADDPWRQLVVKSANNISSISLEGGAATALAADLNLTITTDK